MLSVLDVANLLSPQTPQHMAQLNARLTGANPSGPQAMQTWTPSNSTVLTSQRPNSAPQSAGNNAHGASNDVQR